MNTLLKNGNIAGSSKPKTTSGESAAKSFTGTWYRTKNDFYRLEYSASYDYSQAKLDEWYRLYYKHITLFRKRVVWKPVLTGSGGYSFPVRGDYEWAKKIAKDLNIDLPPATHRLSQHYAYKPAAKKKVRKNAPENGSKAV